jgi:hypothetical protein
LLLDSSSSSSSSTFSPFLSHFLLSFYIVFRLRSRQGRCMPCRASHSARVVSTTSRWWLSSSITQNSTSLSATALPAAPSFVLTSEDADCLALFDVQSRRGKSERKIQRRWQVLKILSFSFFSSSFSFPKQQATNASLSLQAAFKKFTADQGAADADTSYGTDDDEAQQYALAVEMVFPKKL